MNDTKANAERGAGEGERTADKESSKVGPNGYLKEEVVISVEPIEGDYAEYLHLPDPEDDDRCVLFSPAKDQDAEEEPESQTSQEALLAAWWNYKRTNKLNKKKKKKLLTIYRDENYWNDDRYTDDEDFNYTKS